VTTRMTLVAASLTLAIAGLKGVDAPGPVERPAAPCRPERFMMTGGGILEGVDVFPAATADTSTPPIRSLRGENTTLCRPRDLAVDSRGRLHVLSGDVIAVFEAGARGDARPVTTLDLPAMALALDRRDNIYVVTGEKAPSDGNGSITVYERGAEGERRPMQTLAGDRTGLLRPLGIAVDAGRSIYATNESSDTVRIFGAGASGNIAPAGYLAGPHTGLDRPSGLAFDRHGALYVVNARSRTVTVYSPRSVGDAPPVRTIEPPPSEGRFFNSPGSLAVDRHDTLYVAANGAVWVYGPDAQGKVLPVRTLLVPQHDGLAVGKDGTLYVANRSGRVLAFAPGARDSAAPLRTVEDFPNEHGALGLALGAGDTLYVADVRDAAIRTYRPGARRMAVPVRTLSGPNTRISDPKGIAVDRRGALYVANGPMPSTQGAIRAYRPGETGSGSPLRTIWGPRTRLSEPRDVAIDSRGYIHVVNRAGTVTVYAPDADGDAAPVRVISGRNTLLREPAHLAIGPGDTIHVLNGFGGHWKYGNDYLSVTVYPPRVGGEIDPVRTISISGRSGFFLGRFPTGIAVDARGSIYLSDYGSSVVPVYAPGAAGNAAPVRQIRLQAPDTGKRVWGGLGGTAIGIGPRDELFVATFPQQIAFTLR
jgi:sugar lactone lactonase YvrE